MSETTSRSIGDNSKTFTYADLLRVGPGTITGKYLRRFWHPVFAAADIAQGHVKPLRILGEDLTLYRSESGTPHIVGGRCPHRGVQLSLGFVDGDDIRCAYHGWKFDAAGKCVQQPAEPRPFCDQVKIKSYPTQEYLGLIFGYFGEGAPPPLPRLADYEDDKTYACEVSGDIWPVSYFDLLENATDMAHTAFLHWHFGYQAPNNIEWRENECGMAGTFEGTGKDPVFNRSFFDMPTAVEFATRRPGHPGFFARGYRVPRDDNSAVRFNLTAFPRVAAEARDKPATGGTGDEEKAAHPVTDIAAGLLSGREDMRSLKERSGGMNYMYLTNIQDCTVLSSLGPPAQRDFAEFLGGTDLSVALMRRLWLREITAFAEGRPLKSWQRPDFMWQDVTAVHRAEAR